MALIEIKYKICKMQINICIKGYIEKFNIKINYRSFQKLIFALIKL
jgi:hypothetical protein